MTSFPFPLFDIPSFNDSINPIHIPIHKQKPTQTHQASASATATAAVTSTGAESEFSHHATSTAHCRSPIGSEFPIRFPSPSPSLSLSPSPSLSSFLLDPLCFASLTNFAIANRLTQLTDKLELFSQTQSQTAHSSNPSLSHGLGPGADSAQSAAAASGIKQFQRFQHSAILARRSSTNSIPNNSNAVQSHSTSDAAAAVVPSLSPRRSSLTFSSSAVSHSPLDFSVHGRSLSMYFSSPHYSALFDILFDDLATSFHEKIFSEQPAYSQANSRPNSNPSSYPGSAANSQPASPGFKDSDSLNFHLNPSFSSASIPHSRAASNEISTPNISAINQFAVAGPESGNFTPIPPFVATSDSVPSAVEPGQAASVDLSVVVESEISTSFKCCDSSGLDSILADPDDLESANLDSENSLFQPHTASISSYNSPPAIGAEASVDPREPRLDLYLAQKRKSMTETQSMRSDERESLQMLAELETPTSAIRLSSRSRMQSDSSGEQESEISAGIDSSGEQENKEQAQLDIDAASQRIRRFSRPPPIELSVKSIEISIEPAIEIDEKSSVTDELTELQLSLPASPSISYVPTSLDGDSLTGEPLDPREPQRPPPSIDPREPRKSISISNAAEALSIIAAARNSPAQNNLIQSQSQSALSHSHLHSQANFDNPSDIADSSARRYSVTSLNNSNSALYNRSVTAATHSNAAFMKGETSILRVHSPRNSLSGVLLESALTQFHVSKYSLSSDRGEQNVQTRGAEIFQSNIIGRAAVRLFASDQTANPHSPIDLISHDCLASIQLIKSRLQNHRNRDAEFLNQQWTELQRIHCLFFRSASESINGIRLPADLESTFRCSPAALTAIHLLPLEHFLLEYYRNELFPRFLRSAIYKSLIAELQIRYFTASCNRSGAASTSAGSESNSTSHSLSNSALASAVWSAASSGRNTTRGSFSLNPAVFSPGIPLLQGNSVWVQTTGDAEEHNENAGIHRK